MTETKALAVGDIYSLADNKRLVYIGGGKGRLEIKVYDNSDWETAEDNITIPPSAIAKWIALKQ